MGIHSRDYIRESSGSGYGGSGFGGSGYTSGGVPSVCKKLIIANIVVFVLQMVITVQRQPPPGVILTEAERQILAHHPESVITTWLDLDPVKTVRQGQIWRLVTYSFCHDRYGVLHILFNMLFLWWFGRTLELMYGSREFLILYLTAAVFSGFCFVAFAFFMNDMTPAIGASGAVWTVLGLYAFHYPRRQILLFMILPIEIRWFVTIYAIFDIHPILLSLGGTDLADGVAHSAHVGGLAFGYLYYRFQWRLENLLSGLSGFKLKRVVRRGPKLKIYEPKARKENLDARVDEILAKIHEQGESSLTDKERSILTEASQRYKDR